MGLYLSGGLDSSLLAALLSRRGAHLRAFSHGFDRRRDEIPIAEEAACVTGLPWTEARIRPEDLDTLPAIVRAMEQPVANADLVGLWVLARTAKERVRVVLCGEGADELFGSYPHQLLLTQLARLPRGARSAAAAILRALPEAAGHYLSELSAYPGAASSRDGRARLARALGAPRLAEALGALSQLFTEDERRRLYSADLWAALEDRRATVARPLSELAPDTPAHRVHDRLIDLGLSGWLDGYHLGRENRIAMAHGLEARYPYLDDDLVAALLPLPSWMKLGGPQPQEKRLLRRVAIDLLPARLARRRKGPVRVPLALFGARFFARCEEVLSEEAVRRRGLFRPREVRALLDRARRDPFLAGRQLFALLLLETWFRVFLR